MKKLLLPLILVVATGCVGIEQGCSSCIASDFGANWIVVQYNYQGYPINCWKLQNVGITNELQSDGIYWKSNSGHLVHISGWYNRVQVSGGDFNMAAKLVGIEITGCSEGVYIKPQ